MRNDLVLIRGGGWLGTAIAHRLRLSGFPIVVTEATRPTLIHRLLCFGSAVYESRVTVEGVPARRAADLEGLRQVMEGGAIPVLADPPAHIREALHPWVLVDATGLERNVGTRLTDAPIVIGVGMGFTAGRDVHVVVDPRPGQGLGSLTAEGALAEDDVPGPFAGFRPEIVTSKTAGRFSARVDFGVTVRAGDLVGQVGDSTIAAPCDGIVSGLLADGLFVGPGLRVAEVDPRGDERVLHEIDPRARAVAGGVLEAILYIAAVGSEPGQALALESPAEGKAPGSPPVAPAPPGK